MGLSKTFLGQENKTSEKNIFRKFIRLVRPLKYKKKQGTKPSLPFVFITKVHSRKDVKTLRSLKSPIVS